MDDSIGVPKPGFYKTRLWRRGPWFPVRVRRVCHCTPNGGFAHEWDERCDRHPPLSAVVASREADPYRGLHPDDSSQMPDFLFWLPIDEGEYKWLMAIEPLQKPRPKEPK